MSLIGGAYMYRIPSKVRIHFKRYLNIEYMFKDDVEREEFLKLLVKKNVRINHNDLDGMKELLSKLKREKQIEEGKDVGQANMRIQSKKWFKRK